MANLAHLRSLSSVAFPFSINIPDPEPTTRLLLAWGVLTLEQWGVPYAIIPRTLDMTCLCVKLHLVPAIRLVRLETKQVQHSECGRYIGEGPNGTGR